MAESKPKKRWFGDFRAYEGKTIGWTKKSKQNPAGTGWRYEGGYWVQYKNGRKTGRKTRNRLKTTAISSLDPTLRPDLQAKKEKIKADLKKDTTKNGKNKSSDNLQVSFKKGIE